MMFVLHDIFTSTISKIVCAFAIVMKMIISNFTSKIKVRILILSVDSVS